MLDSMISTTEDPAIKDQLRDHRLETEKQADRMLRRLEARGAAPSKVREGVGIVQALMKSVFDATRSEKAGRNARDGYATEHLEIAAYELLARIAKRAGDEETAQAARESLAEEVAMAKKIEANWDRFAELSLQEAGVAAAVYAAATPSPLEARRATDVRLRVVADSRREDLPEPRHVGGGRDPRRVRAVGDRRRNRLQRALEDAALDRPARDDPRRREDRERCGARAGRTRVEDPGPDVGADAIGEPSVRKHESTARAGLFAATLESGLSWMFAIHSSITVSACGVWSEARAGRASVNQITWFDASPSKFSIRLREANDWCELCMSSSASR